MSIENFRSGFWVALVVALVVVLVAFPGLLFVAAAAILVSLALLTRLIERGGYLLMLIALATVGAAGAVAAARLGATEGSVFALAALAALTLALFILLGAWNGARPIPFGQQLAISTIFGPRIIAGPARLVWLPRWLGRVSAAIPLRQLKSAVSASEIDTVESRDRLTVMRLLREGDEAAPPAPVLPPERIHSLDLVVSYRVDGPNWARLYSIPGAEQQLKSLEQSGDGPRMSRDQPEIWERLAEAYITEEAEELLRSVVFGRGWSAAEVSERRAAVAQALRDALGAEAASHGILVDHVEVQRVAVDSLASVRAARDIAVRSSGRAEEVERVGRSLIDLQMQFLRRLQAQLRGGLRPADFETIVRNQLRELSYQAWRHGWLDQLDGDEPPRHRHGAA